MMHKIDWCEGGLQLADIGTKNVSEPDLTLQTHCTDNSFCKEWRIVYDAQN